MCRLIAEYCRLMSAETWRLGCGLFTQWSRYQSFLIKQVSGWVSGSCIFDTRCCTHGECMYSLSFRQEVLFNVFWVVYYVNSSWNFRSIQLTCDCYLNRLWLYWAVGCGDQLRTIRKKLRADFLFKKCNGYHEADSSGNKCNRCFPPVWGCKVDKRQTN